MPLMNKAFFDACRASLFSGRLTQAQVDGLNKIAAYGMQHDYSRPDLAYVLATVHHETGRRMQPIREGFASTDAGARRAVASIHAKGIVSWNYAKPDAQGNSFYGRGLVQITHKTNYAKFEDITGAPLATNPDLALEWEHALPILFVGMRDGMFRSASLKDVPDAMHSPAFDADDRNIINGDVRKNGPRIARYAALYWKALETDYGTVKTCS